MKSHKIKIIYKSDNINNNYIRLIFITVIATILSMSIFHHCNK